MAEGVAGFRVEGQGLALGGGGQAVHLQLQALAAGQHGKAGLALQGLGGLPGSGCKVGGRHGHAALCGKVQCEAAVLGNAFHPAHQPAGLQLDAGHALGVRRKAGRDAGGHGQQHRAFIAIVQQIADADLLRHGPGNVAGGDAGRQLPGQLGGQAGITGVLPVGVPARLVVDAQPQGQGLTGGNTLGRQRHQFGPHPRGFHRRRCAGRCRGGLGRSQLELDLRLCAARKQEQTRQCQCAEKRKKSSETKAGERGGGGQNGHGGSWRRRRHFGSCAENRSPGGPAAPVCVLILRGSSHPRQGAGDVQRWASGSSPPRLHTGVGGCPPTSAGVAWGVAGPSGSIWAWRQWPQR